MQAVTRHVDAHHREALFREVARADDDLVGVERRAVGPDRHREGRLRIAARLRDAEPELHGVARDLAFAGLEVQLEPTVRILLLRIAEEVRRVELADDEVIDLVQAVFELP